MEKPQLSQIFHKIGQRGVSCLIIWLRWPFMTTDVLTARQKQQEGQSTHLNPPDCPSRSYRCAALRNGRKWTNEWNSCGLLLCPVRRVLHMQWIQTRIQIQTHTRRVYTRQPLGGATLRRTNTSTFSLSRGARDKIKTTKYINDPKETIWCSRLDGWRPADHLDSGSAMETHATRDDCNFTAKTGRTWTNWNEKSSARLLNAPEHKNELFFRLETPRKSYGPYAIWIIVSWNESWNWRVKGTSNVSSTAAGSGLLITAARCGDEHFFLLFYNETWCGQRASGMCNIITLDFISAFHLFSYIFPKIIWISP